MNCTVGHLLSVSSLGFFLSLEYKGKWNNFTRHNFEIASFKSPLKLRFYFTFCDCEMSRSNQDIPDTIPAALWGRDFLYWLLHISLVAFCYTTDSCIFSVIILCHLRYILQYRYFPDLAFLLNIWFELIFPTCICTSPSWLSLVILSPCFYVLEPSIIYLSWLMLTQPGIYHNLWFSLPCLCFNSR